MGVRKQIAYALNAIALYITLRPLSSHSLTISVQYSSKISDKLWFVQKMHVIFSFYLNFIRVTCIILHLGMY